MHNQGSAFVNETSLNGLTSDEPQCGLHLPHTVFKILASLPPHIKGLCITTVLGWMSWMCLEPAAMDLFAEGWDVDRMAQLVCFYLKQNFDHLTTTQTCVHVHVRVCVCVCVCFQLCP